MLAGQIAVASDDDLLAILKIGHDSSMRGAGIPVLQALKDRRYRELRKEFDETSLLRVIRSQPALVEEWLAYSADKRSSDGWYVLEEGLVARVGRLDAVQYSAVDEAVAHYVIKELDNADGYRGFRGTLWFFLWIFGASLRVAWESARDWLRSSNGPRPGHNAG